MRSYGTERLSRQALCAAQENQSLPTLAGPPVVRLVDPAAGH
jgi:hypothetical protein